MPLILTCMRNLTASQMGFTSTTDLVSRQTRTTSYDLATFIRRGKAENPLQGVELLQALPYSEYQIAKLLSEPLVCPNKGSYVMLMVAEVIRGHIGSA